jgi:hypothetical protein
MSCEADSFFIGNPARFEEGISEAEKARQNRERIDRDREIEFRGASPDKKYPRNYTFESTQLGYPHELLAEAEDTSDGCSFSEESCP